MGGHVIYDDITDRGEGQLDALGAICGGRQLDGVKFQLDGRRKLKL